MNSHLRSYEQEVAKTALELVKAAKSTLKPDEFSAFKSLADGAPTMILSIGLAATVAFYGSKGKSSHHKQLLICWASILGKPSEGLVEKLLEDVDTYRMATDTIMRHQEWIKRFAKAYEADKSGGKS